MIANSIKGNKRIFIALALVSLILVSIIANSFNLEANFLFPLIGAVGGSLFGPAGMIAGAIGGHGANKIEEAYAVAWVLVAIVAVAAIYGINKGANAFANQCSIYVPPNEGYDCNACNTNPLIPCTEYSCRAIGQRCTPRLNDDGSIVCYEVSREYIRPTIIGCRALTLDGDLNLQEENLVEFYDLSGEIDTERSGTNAAKSRVVRR